MLTKQLKVINPVQRYDVNSATTISAKVIIPGCFKAIISTECMKTKEMSV